MTQRRHELLVGLRVSDDAGYQRYRDEMMPLLEARGGAFRYDFRISEVLKGGKEPFNRLFLLSFPDRATRDAFFEDPAYLTVRAAHFTAAVDAVEIIAEFDQEV